MRSNVSVTSLLQLPKHHHLLIFGERNATMMRRRQEKIRDRARQQQKSMLMKMKSHLEIVVVVTLLLISLLLLLQPLNGFAPRPQKAAWRMTTALSRSSQWNYCRNDKKFLAQQRKLLLVQPPTQQSTTRLNYMLPPSGGGSNKMDWKGLGTSILSILGVLVFFASPLGAIVFSIFNSFLLLSILLPLVGVAAFQFWQAFNTVQGSCPACGAPIRVVKNNPSALLPEAPGLCFNCGSLVQATMDNRGIELVQAGPGIQAQQQQQTGGVSFWDAWFGGVNNIAHEEIIITTRSTTPTTPTNSKSNSNNKMGDRFRRENTVIDVDVEDKTNRF
jgi:hypothetical protein